MSDEAFLAGKRCLVLDDEYLIALDIQQILEAAGAASVTCVGTARDALDALADGSALDIAVLDIRLDGKAGDSLTVAAALSRKGTPFVFLTGLRSDDVHAGEFAHAPVIEKPYQAPALVEAIRQAIAGR